MTGDPPAQARRATALLASSAELILVDLVIAEFVYVLESFYELPRSRIAETVRALIALPSIAVTEHDLLLRTVELYEDRRLDFAEAYLAAAAELTSVDHVASFDRTLARVDTIERIETA